MNLGFSTHWPKRMGDLAGQPTHFVPKIWASIPEKQVVQHINGYPDDLFGEVIPKLHTIREDKNERWREGMDIHFVINNRTKDRYQFMPVIKCTGVQDFSIWIDKFDSLNVMVDGCILNHGQVIGLAKNDGFPDLYSFLNWFLPEGTAEWHGYIIHWTDKKY